MLTTDSVKTSSSTATVYWKHSEQKHGAINVVFPFESNDVDIMAELVAINYLIFDKEIYGLKPLHGSGIELSVSKGAIKKAALNKTAKKELVKFASFINFLLDGCVIKTHKKRSNNAPIHKDDFEIINVDVEKYTSTKLILNTPAMGDIEVTSHALERYKERMIAESGTESKTALKSLANRLMHKELVEVKLPENVIKHKLKKYGRVDDFSVWIHPTSTLNFAFVQNGSRMSLITIFVKKQ